MAVRYEFDETNRLLVRDGADVLRPTRILEGAPRLNRKNRLVYRVASSGDGADGRRAVALDGTWALTRQQGLALTLHEGRARQRQTLFLKGAVVGASASTLTFALRRGETGEASTTQRLILSGRWAADARNRLTFLAEKADGSEDRLTLQGGWELGRRHELAYRFRQRTTRSGARGERALIFDGHWDLSQRDRLVYRLTGSSDSAFEFKASLQSPSLLARDGRIVYQVGVGVASGRTETKRVAFFGTWKLERDLSVSFEIPYADGRREALRLQGTYALTKRNQIAVQLSDRRGQPLGLTVVFTQRVAQDASLFVRLRRQGQELEALGGVRVQF